MSQEDTQGRIHKKHGTDFITDLPNWVLSSRQVRFR